MMTFILIALSLIGAGQLAQLTFPHSPAITALALIVVLLAWTRYDTQQQKGHT